MNAEAKFLPHLKKLHERFPKLKIVLEHATTRAAVEMVKSCGSSVGCSITAHHLSLIVDDWAGQGFHFCKPVAKYPDDREALREVIREGSSSHIRWNSIPDLLLINRSSSIFPGLRLRSSSRKYEKPKHPTARLCCRCLHISHFTCPRCSPARVFWCTESTGEFCQHKWPNILRTGYSC